MTEFKTVRDSRKETPATIDTTSSSTTVYERKNIRRETFPLGTGDSEATVEEWVYEQREYTAEEYAQLTSPATQTIMQAISDLELTVAMQGVE